MWTWADVKSGDERCAFCSCDNQNVLEQHHRIPARFGGTDRKENLVTVCANCHSVLERTFNRNFWNRVKALEFDTVDNTDGQTKLHQEDSDAENIDKNEESEEPEVGLGELAKKIVDEEKVDDITNARNQIDRDLLAYEFDLNPDDTKLLKKLVNREKKKGFQKEPQSRDELVTQKLREKIRKEERNKVITSIYQSTDLTHQEIADGIDLSQQRVSQIVKENA